MKKRVYSEPSMEIVILNGEDIICASNAGDNDVMHHSRIMVQNPIH